MKESSISIALATYNGGLFLARQLETLARQTRLPKELIVCDDQSADDTDAVVQRFASEAPFPVRFVKNAERLGWRANFVKAAGLCTGDLIAFCDQDDLWYPEKLATLEPHFDDPSVLLAHHNADLVDADGKPYGTLLPIASETERIATLSRPTPWSNPLGLTMMFRARLTRYNPLWPTSVDLAVSTERAAHDQWFYFLATNLGVVVSCPERLLGYRQHAGNSVGWANGAPTRHGTPDRAAVALQVRRVVSMLGPFCAVLKKAAQWDDKAARALSRAALKNERLLARFERRLALYHANGIVERSSAMAALVRNGDYRGDGDWSLGRRALLTDATTGLFGGQKRR